MSSRHSQPIAHNKHKWRHILATTDDFKENVILLAQTDLVRPQFSELIIRFEEEMYLWYTIVLFDLKILVVFHKNYQSPFFGKTRLIQYGTLHLVYHEAIHTNFQRTKMAWAEKMFISNVPLIWITCISQYFTIIRNPVLFHRNSHQLRKNTINLSRQTTILNYSRKFNKM